ncbi:MAG: DNA translocase FtsK [Bacteroidetes bacterium]|nr:DNA translocase FtsK [Bacteroidota bacterium]MCL2303664.1 DNA translocase FtsK [Lentimicrobiaceae bacterium]
MKLSNYQQTNKKVTTNHKKQKAASKAVKSAEKKSTKSGGLTFWGFLKSKRMVQVYGILFMAFAILLCISMISSYFHFRSDASFVVSGTEQIDNAVGAVGAHLAYRFINYTFGFFSLGFVLLFFIYGFKLTFERSILPPFLTTLTTLITMAWFSTVFGCFLANTDYSFISGAFGNEISTILIQHTHNWGAGLILFALFVIILVLFYNISPKKMIEVIAVSGKRLAVSGGEEKGERRKEKGEKSPSNFEGVDGEAGRGSLYGKTEAQPHPNGDDGRGVVNQKLSGLYMEDINELRNEYDNKGVTFIGEGAAVGGERDAVGGNRNVASGEEAEFKIVSAPIEGFEDEMNDKSPSNFEGVDGEAGRGSLYMEIEAEFQPNEESNEEYEPLEDYDPRLDLSFYKFPESDLLNEYEIKEMDRETIMSELRENKDKIETTLKNFGILIKQISVTMGPTVTLYEIVPADGIRISKIKNLEDDIALNLAALGIRIIAPIPGKGTIGIEVPNKNAQIVSMKEVINSDKFQHNKYDLPIGLGKTISNEPFVVDLAKMPHLLMAGATGQGKSVGLNAIITSLVYKKHPAELKFVLIDPKKVEFTLYSIIEKHYLAKLPDTDDPIITDTKKVVQTLNSLCVEMDTRYDLLKLAKTRNIKEYNHKFCTRKLSPALGHRYLPYIVLIIDEFGDLIMTAGREIETPIARLAQLARAIGIHLIIATQRPSVNIITGTIKANFPARLAFRVSSKIDSRTILDGNGADQLIGKGDMLLSTGSDLIRLQCAFVDTPEVEKIAQFIEEQQSYPEAFMLPEYVMEEKGKGGSEDEPIDAGEIDPMFQEAAQLIVQTQMGSTSLIQRKMKLGYNRAGRVMDQLEEFGIVGPAMGSKAREVKVKTNEELMQIFQRMGLF